MSRSKTFITINGKAFPNPDMSDNTVNTWSQLVDDGRSAAGIVTSKPVGHRLVKFDLGWSYLTAEEWHDIMVEVNKFYGSLRFYDIITSSWATRPIYFGDAKAQPHTLNDDGTPATYVNCSVAVVDTGG